MEQRMLEAARKGNINELKDLISSNELILKEMALEGAGHTPLHVACVAGHLDAVRELLKHMPKLAEKVNAGGFSPLHIAAAQGEVEIARELLTVGPHLCSVKGRERRIPLHYAVINGELDVMKLLLSASPESIEEATAREETALHLAVKNNRFDAVVVLVEHLKQHKKEQVINWKDHKGNTTLHLAAAGKNFEVVNFLLRGHALESEVVDVNALNESGLTTLDVSTPSQRGARDREIREILVQAGAKHGASRLVSGDDDDIEGGNGHQLERKPATEKESLGEIRNNGHQLERKPATKKESLGEIRNDLLVVAALIASATYQSVLQPPKKTLVHALFLGGNTFGFLMSVQIIICLTKGLPVELPLMLSLIGMVLTYFSFTISLILETRSPNAPATKTVLRVMPLIIAVFLLLLQRLLAAVMGSFLKWLFEFHLLGNMYSLRSWDKRCGCK